MKTFEIVLVILQKVPIEGGCIGVYRYFFLRYNKIIKLPYLAFPMALPVYLKW